MSGVRFLCLPLRHDARMAREQIANLLYVGSNPTRDSSEGELGRAEVRLESATVLRGWCSSRPPSAAVPLGLGLITIRLRNNTASRRVNHQGDGTTC